MVSKHPEDLRADWDDIKLEAMRTALHAKYAQNDDLRGRLLQTEDAPVIEDSERDAFWGWGPDQNGNNWLGVLLAECRAELRK